MCSLTLRTHILSLALLAAPLAIQASNLVVDNNPANDAADYHDLQEAIDAAAAGDIIYVMPSGEDYGDVVLKSGLTLVGAGLDREEFFATTDLSLQSIIKEVVIPVQTSDVFLTGFRFSDTVNFGRGSGGNGETAQDRIIQNIYFFRNVFDDVVGTSYFSVLATSRYHYIDHVYFINNYFWDEFEMEGGLDMDTNERINVYIYNNVFGADLDLIHPGGNWWETDSRTWADVRNNAFLERHRVLLSRGNFSSNLIVDLDPSTDFVLSTYGVVNVGYNALLRSGELSDFPIDEGNIYATSFEEVVVKTSGPWGRYLEPKENSPLLGAGLDGVDIGLYGGEHPWNIIQQPPIPIITNLSGPSIVNPGQGLTLTVEAEANN